MSAEQFRAKVEPLRKNIQSTAKKFHEQLESRFDGLFQPKAEELMAQTGKNCTIVDEYGSFAFIKERLANNEPVVLFLNHLSLADHAVFFDKFVQAIRNDREFADAKIGGPVSNKFYGLKSTLMFPFASMVRSLVRKYEIKKYLVDNNHQGGEVDNPVGLFKILKGKKGLIFVFPEGTRSSSQHLEDTKVPRGFGMLLQSASFAIPIGLVGTEKVLNVKKGVFDINLKAKTQMIFGQPIEIGALVNEIASQEPDVVEAKDKGRLWTRLSDCAMVHLAATLPEKYQGKWRSCVEMLSKMEPSMASIVKATKYWRQLYPRSASGD